MGVTIGPADWWSRSAEGIRSLAINCPVGTTLPDGSRIICKSGGGSAWIIAPCSTQVSSAWAGGQYSSIFVDEKCSISEWSGLNTQLLNCGFNPCDGWFVPNITQLNNPGYLCRTQWDLTSNGSYWSSSSSSTIAAHGCCINSNSGVALTNNKANVACVRAMRCVTY